MRLPPVFPCVLFGLIASASVAFAGSVASYRKQQLTDQFFSEGANFGDFNKDGIMDVVSGPYWYAGPDFKERHEIYPAAAYDPLRYSENFFAFTHDFNGDGWTDVLVLGFPGVDASWYENPAATKNPWKRHVAFLPVDNESPTFGDVLGLGQPVLLCSANGKLGYATWNPKDPTLPWAFHPISPAGPWQRFTHGLGAGDVNGDGRADILEKNGWWEQPASLKGDPEWKFHAVQFAPPVARDAKDKPASRGGAHMHVYDVNGDGLPDVITSLDAHGFGLSWFEQVKSANGGESTFKEHPITSGKFDEKLNGVQFAQLHAVALADLDGDGLLDIVTGKRWWAHGPTGDADPAGAAVLYAFLLRRDANGAHYEPHQIDDASGIGTQVVAADANGDKIPDLVIGNKRGTFVFTSQKTSTTK